MVDKELTRNLAELSKIAFTDSELLKMTEDIKSIIGLMDKVCHAENSTIPHPSDAVEYKSLRADEYIHSPASDKITDNAKVLKDNCFTAPKVV